jgi:hypothetical protein
MMASCGSKTTGVDPSATAVFTAQLLPINERPNPITNAEASGSGTVTITVTITRDSTGTITATKANFQSNLTGFPTTTNFTAAHIHAGSSDVAGGIVVNTNLASGEVPLTNGAGTFTKSNIDITPTLFQTIANDPRSSISTCTRPRTAAVWPADSWSRRNSP